ISEAARAMDDGGMIGIDRCGTGQKRQGRQRLEIRGVAIEIGIVGTRHVCSPTTVWRQRKPANKPSEKIARREKGKRKANNRLCRCGCLLFALAGRAYSLKKC